MWTTKQANRTALVFDATLVVVTLALAVRAAVEGSALGAAAFVAAATYLVYRGVVRHRRGEADMTQGRASDEREAYIQLRAWAAMGQFALFAAIVMVAVDMVLDRPTRWYVALLALGVVHLASVLWMRKRA